MTVHLVKLCVGADAVADLEAWVARRAAQNAAAGRGRVHDHVTRMFPRRRDELLDGGSIYWVIRGEVRARQRILDLEAVVGADGVERCAILLEPSLVLVAPQPRKAFQGWRYLRGADAPADIAGPGAVEEAELRAELSELGLL